MFTSYRSYQTFAWSVKYQSRFVWTDEQQTFLAELSRVLDTRVNTFEEGMNLWRAQNGCTTREQEDGDERFLIDSTFLPDRMKPQLDRANQGRANPHGLPVLYLATEAATAVAEVRPWIGARVSLGRFTLNRPVQVVTMISDAPKLGRIYLNGHEPDPSEREALVMQAVDEAFSEPVEAGNDVADYVPTQIIAELVKSKGLDGIVYRSAVGSGLNVALFDVSAADVRTGHLVKIDALQVDFSETDNPYYVEDGRILRNVIAGFYPVEQQ